MIESIRVLHVDDEPDFAGIVAEFLEREDDRITVETATSAAGGLDRLAEADIDCIVSDYDMPGQDGIEFLETVREKHPDLPFILFTGKGSEEIASEAISRGVTDYLQKGGTEKYTILARRILNAVERRAAERQVDRAERRFQKLVERTSDVICIVDSGGVFDYLCPAAERVLGYASEELVGENGFDYVHPDDRARMMDAFEAMLEDPSHRPTVEFRFQRADGTWVWLEAHGRNLLADPDVEGIVVTVRDVTARKERETELQTERDRRAVLFEQFGEPAVEVAYDGETPIVREVNTAFEETFGRDAASLVGRSLDEAIVGDDDREAARALSQRVKEGELVETELQRETPEGPRTFLFQPVPFTIDDAQHAYGIYIDITERKQHQERFQKYIEQSTDIITVLNPDGTYKYQSPSSERILGYAPEELVGENAFEYVHPDDRASVRETFEEAVADPTLTPTAEYRFRHADGTWRWIESIGNNQLSSPAIEGVVVNSRDVTERKQREQQLRKQNAKLETLHDVAAELNQCETAEEVFNRVMDATEEILAFDRAIVDTAEDGVLVPTAMAAGVHEEGYYEETPIEAEDNLAARVYRTGEPAVVGDLREHEVAPADAAYRSALTVPIGDHGVFQAVATDVDAFDETDQTLTRLLLGHARTTLTRLAKERRLREHERKLARQNEQLNEFVSVVSHDLRNPIEVATAGVELARSECDSEHIETVETALDRMEAIIGDTLTLAREGRTVGDLEPVALADLADRCWRSVVTAGAELRVEDEVTIDADPDRLQHVLENLFRNAINHGAPDVTIRVGRIDDDGFFVADDGPGIPEADRDSIFDPGHTTTDTGTGFGLTIVNRIVKAHGWEIGVTDSQGGGARFEITGVEMAEG